MTSLDPDFADNLVALEKGFTEIKVIGERLYREWLDALRLDESSEVLALHRGLLLAYHQIVAAALAYPAITDRPPESITGIETSSPRPYSLRSALLWIRFEIRYASAKSMYSVLRLTAQRKMNDHDRQYYDKYFFKILSEFHAFLIDPSIKIECEHAFPEMLPRYSQVATEVQSIVRDSSAN